MWGGICSPLPVEGTGQGAGIQEWVTDIPQIQQEVERREARYKDNTQMKTF